jgi:hypothetical protein
MELTEKQKTALEDFAYKVDSEGFGYACENYPIKDEDLSTLICSPVYTAEHIFESLCKEHGIECS